MVAVLLEFCKAPGNEEITLQHFFSCLQQCIFFFHISFVLHAIFFFQQVLAGFFFFKITHPHLLTKVKWSAPYTNTSKSLGEREMLWEHEPQASVSIAFSSSPKLSRVFVKLDRTRNTCFLFVLENIATRKRKTTC